MRSKKGRTSEEEHIDYEVVGLGSGFEIDQNNEGIFCLGNQPRQSRKVYGIIYRQRERKSRLSSSNPVDRDAVLE
jgi:hypothetical protein